MKHSLTRTGVLNAKGLTSMVAIYVLLTMSLSYSTNSRASVETKPAVTNKPSWQVIRDKTIEQRNPSDEVTARLQVSSEGPGEARFSVEDMRAGIHPKLAALGSVSLAKDGFTVDVQEAKGNNRLVMKLQAAGPKNGGAQITLKFNGARYKLGLDVTKALSIAREAHGLDSASRRMRSAELSSEAMATLSSGNDYLSFVRQVEASPALDSLGLVNSLLTTSTDAVNNNMALLAVSYAVKMFAPSIQKSYQSNQSVVKTRDLVFAASHVRKSSAGAAVAHPMMNCTDCINIWVDWEGYCFDLFNLCPIPPDECFWIAAGCLAAGDAFLFNCSRDCT